jgi:hypothetical protein
MRVPLTTVLAAAHVLTHCANGVRVPLTTVLAAAHVLTHCANGVRVPLTTVLAAAHVLTHCANGERVPLTTVLAAAHVLTHCANGERVPLTTVLAAAHVLTHCANGVRVPLNKLLAAAVTARSSGGVRNLRFTSSRGRHAPQLFQQTQRDAKAGVLMSTKPILQQKTARTSAPAFQSPLAGQPSCIHHPRHLFLTTRQKKNRSLPTRAPTHSRTHSFVLMFFCSRQQPSLVESARACLQLRRGVPNDCLFGLEGFSHVWVIYVFHENTDGHLDDSRCDL